MAFEAAGNDEAVQLAIAVGQARRPRRAGRHPRRRHDQVRAAAARRKGLTIAMVRRMNEVYPRAIGLAERGVVDLGALVTHRPGWATSAKPSQTVHGAPA